MFIQKGTSNSLYTSTFLLQYLQDKTGLVDTLSPLPPMLKSGSSVCLTTLGYIFVWVWLLHLKWIHFSLQELASSSSESSVTRRKNPHPRKLDMTTSTLTTEISSDSELQVVQASDFRWHSSCIRRADSVLLWFFFRVVGDVPKQPEKPTKALSPGTFFGKGPKLAKPKTATVGPVRVKAVVQPVKTTKKR